MKKYIIKLKKYKDIKECIDLILKNDFGIYGCEIDVKGSLFSYNTYDMKNAIYLFVFLNNCYMVKIYFNLIDEEVYIKEKYFLKETYNFIILAHEMKCLKLFKFNKYDKGLNL